MLGYLGIAVYWIGIPDVGEFLSINRLNDCLTDSGLLILLGRKLKDIDIDHAEVLLMGNIQQSSVNNEILVINLLDEAFIQLGFPFVQKMCFQNLIPGN